MKISDETIYIYDRNLNLVAKYEDAQLAAEFLVVTIEELCGEAFLDKKILVYGRYLIKTQLVTKCIVNPKTQRK